MIVNSHTITPFALSGTSINEFSIGQHITIQIDCTSTASVLSKSIYFNPAMFTNSITNLTAAPDGGWQYDVPAGLPAPGLNDMDFINCGSGYRLDQNYAAQINFVTNTNFIIFLNFFLTADTDGFVDCGSFPNGYRLTKDNFDNPAILDNSYADVYTEDKKAKFHIGLTAAPYEYINYSLDWTSRFYDSGLYGATGEFTDFAYALSRGGSVVDSFSVYADTIFSCQVDYTGTPDDYYQIFVIRVDDTNAGQNYVDDLELDGAQVTAGVLTAISTGVPNASVTSGSNLANVGGDTYVCSTTFDKSYFTLNGKYRVVVVFWDTPNTITNSFITPVVIVAKAPPEGCQPDITGNIVHYNAADDGDYIKTSVCDRIKTQIDVDRSGYDTCIGTLGYTGDYDTYFSKYKIVITDEADDSVVRTVTSDFSTLLAVGMTRETIGTDERYCYEFRIPDEWAEREFWIQHEIYFNYAIEAPYTDKLVYKQKLCVRDYDQNLDVADQLLIGETLTDNAGNPITSVCDFDEFCVEFEKDNTSGDHNLIGFLKSDLTGIQEEESYNGYLDQLTNDFISSVDDVFTTHLAEVCIDKTQLTVGSNYRICGIAKPEFAFLAPPKNLEDADLDDYNNILLFDDGTTDSNDVFIGSSPDAEHEWHIYETGTPANVIATITGNGGGAISVASAAGYESAFGGTGDMVTVDKEAAAVFRTEAAGIAYPLGTAISWTVDHKVTYDASSTTVVGAITIPVKHRLTIDDSFGDTAPYTGLQPAIGGPDSFNASYTALPPGSVEASGWRTLSVDFDGRTTHMYRYTESAVAYIEGTDYDYTPGTPTGTLEFVQDVCDVIWGIGWSYGNPLNPPLVDGTDCKGDYMISNWTDRDITDMRTNIITTDPSVLYQATWIIEKGIEV